MSVQQLLGLVQISTIAGAIGTVLPFLISVVIKTTWKSWVKELFAIASSIGTGIVVAWANGDLHSGMNVLAAIVVAFGASETAFRKYWHGSDIANQIEQWWPFVKPTDPPPSQS